MNEMYCTICGEDNKVKYSNSKKVLKILFIEML